METRSFQGVPKPDTNSISFNVSVNIWGHLKSLLCKQGHNRGSIGATALHDLPAQHGLVLLVAWTGACYPCSHTGTLCSQAGHVHLGACNASTTEISSWGKNLSPSTSRADLFCREGGRIPWHAGWCRQTHPHHMAAWLDPSVLPAPGRATPQRRHRLCFCVQALLPLLLPRLSPSPCSCTPQSPQRHTCLHRSDGTFLPEVPSSSADCHGDSTESGTRRRSSLWDHPTPA